MASYGWRQVLDNIHTLPEVHGFEPTEWINMLTTNERAQLAAHVAQYSSADRAMLDIDTSRSASSVTPAEADVVANVVAARAALDDVVCVLVAQVKSALSDNYPVAWEPGKQFDPGGAQSCHHDISACTAESSSGLPIQRFADPRQPTGEGCSPCGGGGCIWLAHDTKQCRHSTVAVCVQFTAFTCSAEHMRLWST